MASLVSSSPPAVDTPAAPAVLTFLFADIRGYTRFTEEEGDEAAAQLTAAFAGTVAEAVEPAAGRVLELRGDEAVAVFHSARQALRAGVDLQARWQENQPDGAARALGIGVGIDAGEAVPLEGGYRGGALNLAARLCSLAGPGEVLASATVTNLAGRMDGIECTARGEVQLKGFTNLVPVFLVRSGDAAALTSDAAALSDPTARELPIGGFLGALPPGALVGRSDELALLTAVVEEVLAGGGRFAVLSGEPGAGKTRLAQELTLAARDVGFMIAAGSCYETRESSAFYPFVTILSTLYRLASPDLRDRVGRQWPALSQLIPLMPVAGGAKFAGGEEEDRLFWSVFGLVEALADGSPLAILVDDLHWADASSLELLHYLARATRGLPVLILGTYRDTEIRRGHPLEATLRNLDREQLLIRVPVRRLDEGKTRQLVASLMDRTEVPGRLAELIHGRTEGNPFFVQQVVRVLSLPEGLAVAGEEPAEESLRDLAVPESIRSVTAQRVLRLDDRTQELLSVASVLGQSFLFSDLLELAASAAATAGAGEEELEAMLARAAANGLVTTSDGELYSFDHSLTREAIYCDIPTRRRRRLHLAAGHVLEASDTAEARAADVAHHYLEGDDPERALPFVVLAGKRAMDVGAYAEAGAQLEIAAGLAAEVGNDEMLAQSRERLGESLFRTGAYEKAAAALDAAAEVYGELGDATGRARCCTRAALAVYLCRRPDEALARLETLLPALERLGDRRLQAAAHAVQARVFLGLGQPERQAAAALESERLSRETGDRATLASALIDRAVALERLGHSRDMMPLLEEAIDLAGQLGDDLLLWRALNTAAVASWPELGLARGEEYHRLALEAAERSGSPLEIAHARMVRAVYSWLRGEWTEATHWAESAATVAASLRRSTAEHALVVPAWLLAQKGREEEATRRLTELLDQSSGDEGGVLRHHVNLVLAMQDLIQNRPAKAAALAEAALPDTEVRRTFRLQWLLVALQAAVDERHLDRALSLMAEAAPLRPESPWQAVDRDYLAASVRALEGSFDEAESAFASVLEAARAMPYRLGEANILRAWALAKLSAGEKSEAGTLLREAHAGYRALGARPMADAVEAELLSLGIRTRPHLARSG
ncbi:MAG TPA: AAA family ATPase [Chloroflexota bacterium]|nr:AAA family ATPase [Chloroflexota bacterium]